MNNKKLGTAFERKMCEILSSEGYWVHFIVPDARGAQPFDIIAVKDGLAYAFDCKTNSTHRFSISRIEDNQHMAFKRWMKCGNIVPALLVLYADNVYLVLYDRFEVSTVIDLKKEEPFIYGFTERCVK